LQPNERQVVHSANMYRSDAKSTFSI
jgi:hypothetical protein